MTMQIPSLSFDIFHDCTCAVILNTVNQFVSDIAIFVLKRDVKPITAVSGTVALSLYKTPNHVLRNVNARNHVLRNVNARKNIEQFLSTVLMKCNDSSRKLTPSIIPKISAKIG